MFKQYLSNISQWSGLSLDMIDNIVFTGICLGLYFPAKWFIRNAITKKLATIDEHDLVKENLPPLLRLILLGTLIKIWFAGKASIASFFAMSEHLMNQFVLTSFVYLFYRGIKLLADAVINLKYGSDANRQFNIRRTTHVIIGAICALMLFKVWVASTSDFSTYFGLVSAGLAIALQDVIVSLVGWIFIMVVKPFQIGDRIQVADHSGDVTDLRMFQFSLMETGHWINADQATGRILHFPNSYVFKNVIANYNAGFDFIFVEIPIMVTFESDWKKALGILENVLRHEIGAENHEATRQIRRAARNMKLYFSHTDSRVLTSVADSGVVLTLRFLCRVTERRVKEQAIWKAVLEAFGKEDSIDFAYPTQRFYTNHIEGKSQAGGPAPSASI